jgi:predicted dehydrogenase
MFDGRSGLGPLDARMDMNQNEVEALGVNRRDFLKSGSFATLMTMLGGVQLFGETNAPPAASDAFQGPPIKVALIGLGSWGREILNVLSKLPQADIAAISDTYGASLRRSASAAPKAAQVEDYKAILENKEIKAVIIATPTHQHKDLVLAALKAGKHVYCEAPLANTIEDARAIAGAARAAKTQVFQSGLQMRSDPQRHFLLPFIRSGALGKSVMARSQWHKKQSWRAASPNADREKALNWRLRKETSLGLIGEIGIHQLDQACWFLNARPTSVIGFGSTALWKDDRDVFDTIQAIFEFPGNVRLTYDCTLANSFDADYEMYYGTDAAVMLRENKAWMFKEVDSPLLGWEVYARRDTFYRETGIALMAGGSKQTALDNKSASGAMPLTSTPLYNAIDVFIRNAAQVSAAAEDFVTQVGADDPDALREHLLGIKRRPAAGFLEGFQAAVTAIKANEAILSGQRIVFQKDWHELT